MKPTPSFLTLLRPCYFMKAHIEKIILVWVENKAISCCILLSSLKRGHDNSEGRKLIRWRKSYRKNLFLDDILFTFRNLFNEWVLWVIYLKRVVIRRTYGQWGRLPDCHLFKAGTLIFLYVIESEKLNSFQACLTTFRNVHSWPTKMFLRRSREKIWKSQ